MTRSAMIQWSFSSDPLQHLSPDMCGKLSLDIWPDVSAKIWRDGEGCSSESLPNDHWTFESVVLSVHLSA